MRIPHPLTLAALIVLCASPAGVAQEATGGPDLPSERVLYVAPGQSLTALIRELYSERPGQWDRIRRWILDNNPHALAQDEASTLRGDVRIRLPQASAFAREQARPERRAAPVLRFGGRYLFVDPSQSLRELVPKVYPQARARWDEIVDAIMARNDEVFAATAADAPIGRGTRLSIPELAAPADTHADGGDGGDGERDRVRVGELVAASGRLVAVDGGGDKRILASGQPVYRGDTIRTGQRGRASIELRDGESLTLRPDSEIRIRAWRLPETGPGERVIELVEGGLRAVTGALGNREADDYRTITPETTLGVRGTRYAVRICGEGACRGDGGAGEPLPEGVYLGVDQGRVTALNAGGDARFNAGEFGYVADRTRAPEHADAAVAEVVYTAEERAAIAERTAPSDEADDERQGSGWLLGLGGLVLLGLAL